MRLRLVELQESDEEAWKIRAEDLNDYKKLNKVLYQQRLLFVSWIIPTELINWHYNNPLIDHFGIDKTKELIG